MYVHVCIGTLDASSRVPGANRFRVSGEFRRFGMNSKNLYEQSMINESEIGKTFARLPRVFIHEYSFCSKLSSS